MIDDTSEYAGELAAEVAIDSIPSLPSDLTEDQARVLEADTVWSLERAWGNVQRLYLGRAWLARGYASWDDYCTAELRGRIALPREDRPAVVQSLRDAGLSTRAIASAVGSDDRTVRRDLSTAANAAVDPAPTITGVNGKSYAPPPPKPPVWQPPPPDPVAAREAESLANRREDFRRLCDHLRGVRSGGGAYFMADYDPQVHLSTDRERETFTTPFLVETAAVLAELIEWSKA